MSEIAYLDLCCFKRPFDDATIERIRREAEAVAAIFDMAQAGTLSVEIVLPEQVPLETGGSR